VPDPRQETETDPDAGDPADRVPVAYWVLDHPVPDLANIPEERWRDVLRQVPDEHRHRAARLLPPPAGTRAIMHWLELAKEDHERTQAAHEKAAFPGPLPRPAATRARLSRDHQVSFRLTPAQYAEVQEAGNMLGLKPAQLARMLTLRGVAQVLAERDAS
jgi:hypothetical protein